MRLLLITLGSLFVFTAQAQSKLGLKFSPIISSNRIALIDQTYDIKPDAAGAKFSLGLIYDHELTDTYYISTGLILVPKKIGFSISPEVPADSTLALSGVAEEYNLTYLQIPVSLKLFTNEIIPDGRIFFQVGMAGEIKVSDLPVKEEYTQIEKFKGFDTSVLFGGGFEYRAGINTTLFFDVCYQRGLSNVVKTLETNFEEELFIRSSILSIDFGIKF